MPADGIVRSTYYDEPAVSVDDTALVEMMVTISDSFETYGYRRMRAARANARRSLLGYGTLVGSTKLTNRRAVR